MKVIKPYERLSGELDVLREAISSLEPKYGIDGREVEIQNNGRAIQWRYENEDWVDLIPLDAIRGEQGIQGIQGINGKDGINGLDGKNGKDGKQGIRGLNGKDGKDGENGSDIMLRVADYKIQWKLRKDKTWKDLIALDLLQGPRGGGGPAGRDGVGVPAGGSAGQVLVKINATDYNTHWVAQGGGGGTNLFIQELAPVTAEPVYEWWETDGSGNLVTLWVETNGL